MEETELARIAGELLRITQTAALATHSHSRVGFPFASLVEFAIDDRRLPLLLLSRLAMHSKNLRHDPRASLLVAATGEANVLSLARATFVGEFYPADDASQGKLKEKFVASNPHSVQWAAFGDFQIYELQLESLYVITGFGGMGWVRPGYYQETFFAEGSA